MMRLIAWIGGWRRDHDGWIVRARRDSDPDLTDRPDIGFVEEAAIAVRTWRQAATITLCRSISPREFALHAALFLFLFPALLCLGGMMIGG